MTLSSPDMANSIAEMFSCGKEGRQIHAVGRDKRAVRSEMAQDLVAAGIGSVDQTDMKAGSSGSVKQ
jgi:hypothetical protein